MTERDQSPSDLYLATCGGTFCLDPNSIRAIEPLTRNGYTQTSVCKDDKRSRHGAKTCVVQLVWLTEKGVSAGRDGIQAGLEKSLEALATYIGSLNPRTRMLVLSRLNEWLRQCSAAWTPPPQPIQPQRRAGPWAMFPRFEWDVKIPGAQMSLVSILPDRVGGEVSVLTEKLVGLGLAAEASTGHSGKGWSPEKTLVTSEEVARRLQKTYGGFELPFPLDPLVRLLRKSDQECYLIQMLEVNKRLDPWYLDHYMQYASYSDLLEFLKNLESAGGGSYVTVNWPIVEKRFSPGAKIGMNWEDFRGEVLSIRTTQHQLEPWARLRYERLLEACRDEARRWFEGESDEKDEQHLPSWNEMYAMSEKYLQSQFLYYTNLAKMKLGPGTESDVTTGSS